MKVKNILASLVVVSALGTSLSYGGVKNENPAVQSRVLWGAKISPYVRKVMVELEEKKIPYELKEILPTKLLKATKQEIPASFEAASPLGKIPAYEEHYTQNGQDKTFTMSDSAVIGEYLDQTVDNMPLRPKCSKANARVSFMIKYADDVLAPLTHGVLFQKVVKPSVLKQETDQDAVKMALTQDLPPVLDYLEKTLAGDSRTWIADTKNISLADIAIVSHLVTLQTAQEDLDALIGENRPHLKAYVNKVAQRDSFKKALAA